MKLLALAFLAVYFFFRLKRDLHFLQQNSYFNSRYLSWLRRNPKDRLSSFPLGAAAAALLWHAGLVYWAMGLLAVCTLVPAWQLASAKQKKPLVFTQRAIRLFMAQWALALAVFLPLYLLAPPPAWLFAAAFLGGLSFVPAMGAVLLMQPVEGRINQWYVDHARRLLNSMPSLKIIGITGSYGKTSVKHFLTRILSERYNVLMTPGSYNTTLGVVRTVREQLKPTHEVFVAEMGAKNLGDIREICGIARPHISILTAVGPQHLETFGSQENVQKGKFEIVEALPEGGLAILNHGFPLVKSGPVRAGIRCVSYALEGDALFTAGKLRYTPQGMVFDVLKGGEKIMELQTRLLGAHNVSNLLAACAAALELGMDPVSIGFAVRQIEPVKHRLEIKPNPAGITIIDDAFNANPEGAKMALEVLAQVSGNRKIVVTPGMIELGSEEQALNRAFGTQIAQHCDYAVLVGPKQTAPIKEGLLAAGFPENKLFVARNLAEASQHLRQIGRAGDVVLYENDLPDTYNE